MPLDSLATRIPHSWTDPYMPYPPEYVESTVPHIVTSMVDSIAADTVAPHILTPGQSERLAEARRADSIVAAREYAEAHSGHAEGLAPAVLPSSFGQIDAVGVLVAVALVVAGLGAGGIRRALRSYRTALWSVRRRQNAFDDTHKAPLRASLILIMLTVVFGGLALYCATPWSIAPTFAGAVCGIGLAAVYYFFQLFAYATVGYAFSTSSGRSLWLAGFTATQAYTGLAMVIPVMLMLFMPHWREPLLWVCAVLFLTGKCIFIGKGFRIFYHKIQSLLYFILYLCTLEIIPVLMMYAALCYLEAFIAA